MLSFFAFLSGCGIDDSARGGETLDTFDLVVETVNDEISKGTDGKIVMTVTDEISDDDLKNINHSIDTMQGNVTSITTYNKANSGKRKIELDFERSDAMYVYDHIIDGKEIPEDKDKAIETLNRIRDFIRENKTIYCSTHCPDGYLNVEQRKIMKL